MAGSRRVITFAAAAVLVMAGCTSSTATWPAGATPTGAMTPGASATEMSSAGAIESEAATLPKAPTNFTVTMKTGVACPAGSDAEDSCVEWTFKWGSDEGKSTAFGVYRGSIGIQEDDCSTAKASAQLLIWSDPGARSVKFVEPLMVGAAMCYWLAADNVTGESDWVAEAKPAAPKAPTGFTADQGDLNVTCPAGVGEGDNCWSWTFKWNSDSGPETWFEINQSTQDAGQACPLDGSDSTLLVTTDPGARSVAVTYEMGVRSPCYWINAVNTGGSSTQVASQDN
jgi:hypothetical protein